MPKSNSSTIRRSACRCARASGNSIIDSILAFKLTLVPALIGGITLAGRRWGPGIAGWLSGFPVVTGPILLFVGLEQGPQFASMTAAGALTGGIAWLAFAIAYSWAAMHMSWFAALAVGLAAWMSLGVALVYVAPPFVAVIVTIVVAVLLAPRLLPRPAPSTPAGDSSPVEIYARMIAGGAMTVAVTRLSPMLGPNFSGLLSVFPVMGIVLAAFSHRASGGAFAARLLRGMVSGFYAFTAYCVTVALAVPRVGVAWGFLLTLCLSLITHFCILRWAGKHLRPASANRGLVSSGGADAKH